jgi:hypothetical protein
MTPAGHFNVAILFFFALPFPLNWIFVILSHFLADKFPEYYTLDWEQEKLGMALYGLGTVVSLCASLAFAYFYLDMSIKLIIIIFLIALFPDISEVFYVALRRILKKDDWPQRFWICHNGKFPFSHAPYPVLLRYRKNFALTKLESVLLEASILVIIIVLYIVGIV